MELKHTIWYLQLSVVPLPPASAGEKVLHEPAWAGLTPSEEFSTIQRVTVHIDISILLHQHECLSYSVIVI
jgi:hypothetical protein